MYCVAVPSYMENFHHQFIEINKAKYVMSNFVKLCKTSSNKTIFS